MIWPSSHAGRLIFWHDGVGEVEWRFEAVLCEVFYFSRKGVCPEGAICGGGNADSSRNGALWVHGRLNCLRVLSPAGKSLYGNTKQCWVAGCGIVVGDGYGVIDLLAGLSSLCSRVDGDRRVAVCAGYSLCR